MGSQARDLEANVIYLCSYVGKGTVGNAVIRAWTRRHESHSDLLLGDMSYASTVRDGGVRAQRSSKTLAHLEHWVVEPCSWITPEQLIAHYTKTAGQGYDWIGLIGSQTLNRGINNKGAAFCSEWIAQAGGVPNPELYNPGTLRDLNRYLNEVVR